MNAQQQWEKLGRYIQAGAIWRLLKWKGYDYSMRRFCREYDLELTYFHKNGTGLWASPFLFVKELHQLQDWNLLNLLYIYERGRNYSISIPQFCREFEVNYESARRYLTRANVNYANIGFPEFHSYLNRKCTTGELDKAMAKLEEKMRERGECCLDI